jgi:hypothetical protein
MESSILERARNPLAQIALAIFLGILAMYLFATDAKVYFSALLAHTVTLLAGCGATVMVGLLQKYVLKQPLSSRWELTILAAFLFFAAFQAWRDEHDKVQEQAAYLEAANIQSVFPGNPFPIGRPIFLTMMWVNLGKGDAYHPISNGRVYIVPNQNFITTLESVIEDWKKRLPGLLKDSPKEIAHISCRYTARGRCNWRHDYEVAHSIAHFAIEWGHDAAPDKPSKSSVPRASINPLELDMHVLRALFCRL